MSGTDVLEVHAFLEESDGKVRLRWKVTNNSEKRIELVGYYCPFFKDREEMGVWLREKKRWAREQVVIRSKRFGMVLGPEETRTYVWAWVLPKYYGILDTGSWHYKLSIIYRFEDSGDIQRISAVSAPIQFNLIDERDMRYFSSEVIHLLREKFPRIQSLSRDVDLTNALYSHRASRVVDAVFRDDDSLILVELDNYLTLDDIRRVEGSRQKVEKFYGRQMGLDTIAVLIAKPVNEALKQTLTKYEKLLVLVHPFSSEKTS